MIRNKLSVLLAERDLKITRVSRDTGISRSTLNNISKNETDMIRLGTINDLCKYLKITPGDFFEYEALDIKFEALVSNGEYEIDNKDSDNPYNSNNLHARINDVEFDIFMDIETSNKTYTYDLSAVCLNAIEIPILSTDPFDSVKIEVEVNFDNEIDYEDYVESTNKHLSPSFRSDVYDNLKNTIIDTLNNYFKINVAPEATGIINLDGTDESFEKIFKDIIDNLVLKSMWEVEIKSDVFSSF